MRQETKEYQAASTLYDFCVDNFSDWLTLMLLKVYQCSSNDVVRFQSISLLSDTLAELRSIRLKVKRKRKFSLVALNEIKTLVISCVKMQETKESDIKILRRIVAFVAYNVAMLGYGGWDELSDCILSLANSNQALKAFHAFVDLPALYGKFIFPSVVEKMLEKSKKVLLNPKEGREQEWNLALQIVFKTGIQISNSQMRLDLTNDIDSIVLELKNKEMERFLDGGLEDLIDFLARDGNLVKYDRDQRAFVVGLAFRFADGYKSVNNSDRDARKFLDVVEKPEKYNQGSGFDYGWFDHLNRYSSLELLRIFASTDLQERSRDMATRRLNLLLSYHT